jgi:hypothetical protein
MSSIVSAVEFVGEFCEKVIVSAMELVGEFCGIKVFL